MSDWQPAFRRVTDEVMQRLGDNFLSLYLYGSVAMEDFRPGWSDLDILCLTKEAPSEDVAQELVGLRQRLAEETGNPFCRSVEGAIVAREEFAAGRYSRVIYWGTSGERVTDRYDFDSFSRLSLLNYGYLMFGEEIRYGMAYPTPEEIDAAAARHLATIRQTAAQTGPSLYSCGWLLDICRCLYTLRSGDVMTKTAAGEWALREGLCPVEDDLRRALTVRREPMRYKDDPDTQAWLSGLAPAVKRFADVLEAALTEGK